MNEQQNVSIIEVGPRDGLQNEKGLVTTENKLTFIKMLLDAGITSIEPTSFVHPKYVPQMGDAAALYSELIKRVDPLIYNLSCLVPNVKGYEQSQKVGVKEIAIFSAASDSFSKKNVHATVDESLANLKKVAAMAKSDGVKVRGYVSTVFGCPYEGQVDIDRVHQVCETLFNYGCYEVSLGDTIGVATPGQVQQIIPAFKKNFDLNKLAFHFHDTRGIAMANVLTAFNGGARIFDASAGGLGGCPYAPGSTGNVATEDLVYMFNSMGVNSGIDLAKLLDASLFILTALGKRSPSRLVRSLRKVEGAYCEF